MIYIAKVNIYVYLHSSVTMPNTSSSAVLKTLEDLRVDMILGERLDLSTTTPEAAKFNERGQRVVRTEKGREVAADLMVGIFSYSSWHAQLSFPFRSCFARARYRIQIY